MIKRFFKKLGRIYSYLNIIWNINDFDYSSAIIVFRYQLLRIANFLRSDQSNIENANYYAERIYTIIRLMDKVYEEEYSTEYVSKMKEKFGDNVLESTFVPVDGINGGSLKRIKWAYEDWENAEEIRVEYKRLLQSSIEKQERAHKLLWDMIERYIRTFWD